MKPCSIWDGHFGTWNKKSKGPSPILLTTHGSLFYLFIIICFSSLDLKATFTVVEHSRTKSHAHQMVDIQFQQSECHISPPSPWLTIPPHDSLHSEHYSSCQIDDETSSKQNGNLKFPMADEIVKHSNSSSLSGAEMCGELCICCVQRDSVCAFGFTAWLKSVWFCLLGNCVAKENTGIGSPFIKFSLIQN